MTIYNDEIYIRKNYKEESDTFIYFLLSKT